MITGLSILLFFSPAPPPPLPPHSPSPPLSLLTCSLCLFVHWFTDRCSHRKDPKLQVDQALKWPHDRFQLSVPFSGMRVESPKDWDIWSMALSHSCMWITSLISVHRHCTNMQLKKGDSIELTISNTHKLNIIVQTCKQICLCRTMNRLKILCNFRGETLAIKHTIC